MARSGRQSASSTGETQPAKRLEPSAGPKQQGRAGQPGASHGPGKGPCRPCAATRSNPRKEFPKILLVLFVLFVEFMPTYEIDHCPYGTIGFCCVRGPDRVRQRDYEHAAKYWDKCPSYQHQQVGHLLQLPGGMSRSRRACLVLGSFFGEASLTECAPPRAQPPPKPQVVGKFPYAQAPGPCCAPDRAHRGRVSAVPAPSFLRFFCLHLGLFGGKRGGQHSYIGRRTWITVLMLHE